MKKNISLVLALTFIFAAVLQLPVLAEDSLEAETPKLKITTTSLTTSSLEKIPSPDKINLYNQIKKIGTDLFGIRKASSTIANIQKNDTKKATSTITARIEELKKAGLEKISSLDQIKSFEKITKVGNDLFGIKKKEANVLPTMTAELITCASAAIDTKDTSISAAFTTANSEITSAISTRGTCQKAALALTSEREEAIKKCNKAFQETTKTANDKIKKSQKEAWETYKNSLKACSKTTNSTLINIEDGGEILK